MKSWCGCAFRSVSRLNSHGSTFLSPQSPSAAPALSAADVLLCVASPPSRSRWGTSGHTHLPEGLERHQRKNHWGLDPMIRKENTLFITRGEIH